MRVLTIIGLVVLALSLVSCATSPETPYPSPAPSPTPGDGTLHQVSIKGFAFTPQEVTIKVGDTVTWTNEDAARHTVTGGAWDSGDLAQGQNYSRLFAQAGTYDYTCTYHPNMKGKVIVQ